jgi:putative acetyltransferase
MVGKGDLTGKTPTLWVEARGARARSRKLIGNTYRRKRRSTPTARVQAGGRQGPRLSPEFATVPVGLRDTGDSPRKLLHRPSIVPVPQFEIRRDDLTGGQIAALLEEHLHGVALHSPPESIHALDLDRLRSGDITFWSVWDGAELAGCGALKELDPRHGEIKSMRTATAHLRRGVAAALLEHVLGEARRRGYSRISLETGSMAGFEPARRLYAKFGFLECGPFAGYKPDPHSTFMTLEI